MHCLVSKTTKIFVMSKKNLLVKILIQWFPLFPIFSALRMSELNSKGKLFKWPLPFSLPCCNKVQRYTRKLFKIRWTSMQLTPNISKWPASSIWQERVLTKISHCYNNNARWWTYVGLLTLLEFCESLSFIWKCPNKKAVLY